MNKLYFYRVALIVGLLFIIGGAIFVAANATKDAPHQTDAKGGHDHDGDGKPDH